MGGHCLGCRRVRACATGCVVKARPCDGIARPAWAVHAPNHAACDRDEFECEEEDEPGDSRAVITLERGYKSAFPHCRRSTSNVAAVPAGGGHVFVVGDTCRSRHARQPPTALPSTVPTLPGRDTPPPTTTLRLSPLSSHHGPCARTALRNAQWAVVGYRACWGVLGQAYRPS